MKREWGSYDHITICIITPRRISNPKVRNMPWKGTIFSLRRELIFLLINGVIDTIIPPRMDVYNGGFRMYVLLSNEPYSPIQEI